MIRRRRGACSSQHAPISPSSAPPPLSTQQEEEPEKYQSHFSKYVEEGIEPGDIEDLYKEVRGPWRGEKLKWASDLRGTAFAAISSSSFSFSRREWWSACWGVLLHSEQEKASSRPKGGAPIPKLVVLSVR